MNTMLDTFFAGGFPVIYDIIVYLLYKAEIGLGSRQIIPIQVTCSVTCVNPQGIFYITSMSYHLDACKLNSPYIIIIYQTI